MQRGNRTVMACVHRLKHVYRFVSATLSNDDSIWTHPETLDQKVTCCHGFRKRLCYQADYMRLFELEFGNILNGEEPLSFRNELRKAVQKRTLSGSGSTGDDDIHASDHAVSKEFRRLLRQCVICQEIPHGQPACSKPTDG